MSVWSVKLQEKESLKIDISELPAGIYTLRVIGEGDRATNHKFIKQ